MKLRNKKTGEIGNLVLNINPNRESYTVLSTENGDTVCGNLVLADYDTLEELNAEWEDYEEPKEHWAIDQFGDPINVSGLSRLQLEKLHRLGNDFPSENATMKAIEKLKAWKRLKDKGFRFNGVYDEYIIKFTAPNEEIGWFWCNGMGKDLDLLFGGEE